MSESIKPIAVKDFISKYFQNQSLFETLPEFSFIKPVAAKAFEKKCTCGLGQEIGRATAIYNDVVESFEGQNLVDLINRFKTVFGVDKACFVVQTADTNDVKCF